MDPPPFVPTLSDVPPELAAYFERAFPSNPALFRSRPLAAEWVAVLNRFESELITCRVNTAHHHAKAAPGCPWCRLENGRGVMLFPLGGVPAESAVRSNFDLNAAMAAIDRMLGPGAAPNPVQVIPRPTGMTRSPAARETQQNRMTRRIGGLLLAAACIALMMNGLPITFFGLFAAGFMFFGGGDANQQLRAADGLSPQARDAATSRGSVRPAIGSAPAAAALRRCYARGADRAVGSVRPNLRQAAEGAHPDAYCGDGATATWPSRRGPRRVDDDERRHD